MVALIGLVKIELPSATINLCDGGFIVWNGDTYRSRDATFGVIGSIESLTGGIGEEIPALEMTLLPPEGTAPATLAAPGYQQSEVFFWIAEYDQDAGTVTGTPDLIFSGQIDTTTLTVGRSRRELSISIVSNAERLFIRNEGNSLTPRWHKSIWANETGHDNAIGLTIPVAWGTESRPGANTAGVAQRSGGGTYSGGTFQWGGFR